MLYHLTYKLLKLEVDSGFVQTCLHTVALAAPSGIDRETKRDSVRWRLWLCTVHTESEQGLDVLSAPENSWATSREWNWREYKKAWLENKANFGWHSRLGNPICNWYKEKIKQFLLWKDIRSLNYIFPNNSRGETIIMEQLREQVMINQFVQVTTNCKCVEKNYTD